MAQIEYRVRVSCMTYNHASFIVDAMNGFCIQETTFPFVCAIIDDASTDGEQEVIKKYLQDNFDLEDQSIVRQEDSDDYILIFARHKTNTNCCFAVLFLKYNHYSIKKDKMHYISELLDNVEYHASCEGDDYWIDPQKLQKQVLFLDSHPDYVLCCHETKRYNQDTGEMSFPKHKILDRYPNGFSFDSSYDGWNYDGWLTQTLTNLFRADYEGKDIYLSMTQRYDVIFSYFITRAGKCFLMPDVMSVYRVHNQGICSGTPFTSFYLNILSAFQELNQKDNSHDARVVLQRHVWVNIGNLFFLREWSAVNQSIKAVKDVTPLFEYVVFLQTLFYQGICQIMRMSYGILKNKIMKKHRLSL